MFVKAFIVNVNKRLKPFFLEQHINSVNNVTLQSFWFIFNFVEKNKVRKTEKDSNDEESIQSSTTPVPGYQMGK